MILKASVGDLLPRLPGPRTARWPDGERFVVAFTRASLSVELYAPRGVDPQAPHARDEVYLVVSGRGAFVAGGERTSFEPGDVLFAAAGVEHRFEDFSPDFVTWVVFYGPEGGERPQEPRAR